LLAQGPKAWVSVYFTQIESTEVIDQHTLRKPDMTRLTPWCSN
jgi:hypothetical protein